VLMPASPTAVECIASVARLELAALEIGLGLWRRWVDIGGTLARDLAQASLAVPRSVTAPAPVGSTGLESALGRFLGELSQIPFQLAMQLLVEARAWLAASPARADASHEEITTAIEALRRASHVLTQRAHALTPDAEGARSPTRGLERIAAELDEIRLSLQRLLESSRRAPRAGPPA
jgi:hypothetical protein